MLLLLNVAFSNFSDTVKPALVTTSIKQWLVLCDLNFNFPLQWISYQLHLYLATTCDPISMIPLEGHIRQVWLFLDYQY